MADLDDFFAKKDRKKSKTKKFPTSDELAKKLEDTTKKCELKPKETQLPSTQSDDATVEIESADQVIVAEEDEWRDFEEEGRNIDYSGLKIQNLQVNDDEDYSGTDNDGADPDGEDVDGERGAWKKVAGESVPTNNKSVPKTDDGAKKKGTLSTASGGVYISPALRNQQTLQPIRMKKDTLPDINNEEYFPTLGDAKKEEVRKKKNEPAFEEVKQGARYQRSTDLPTNAPVSSVEFFFTKEVTHFITDIPVDREPILSTSPLFSSKTTKDASLPPKQTTPLSQPKSRADAMVQRARKITEQQTNTLSSIDSSIPTPIQLARNLGIPIWTTDYTLKFVEKISLSRKNSKNDSKQNHYHRHHQHQKAAKAKSLSGEYIKIESTQKHYRPYYQEFKSWPMINFNCSVCPFQSTSDQKTKPKTKHPIISAGKTSTTKQKEAAVAVVTKGNDNNISAKSIESGNNIVPISHITMTRKTRNGQMRNHIDVINDIKTNNDDVNPNSNDKGGYCEKCRIEYDVLSLHLQSKEHVNFVKNNDNYIALDNLMNSGTDVKTFLRMNSNQVISDMDTNCIGSPRTASFDSNEMAENDDVSVIENHKQTVKKLPKYSPPITRRSQTKSIIDFTDDDDTRKSITDTNDKFKNDKSINPINFDLNGYVENVFLKTDDNSFRNKAIQPNKASTNSNKKTKSAPPDESPPMPKRLIRAFPRYKVIDEPDATKMTDKPAKTPKNNAAVVGIAEKINETHTTADENVEKDAAGNLIVKFKRVRESELSKLTYEADNFMFPKQRDELPTDEDRQSTSEHCDGDLSSDILSSEYNSQRESLPNSLNNSLNNSATSVDQFTISGRRRKRRSQFDTFKSPMEPKRKFQTSPIQSRLSSNKGKLSLTTSTAIETQASPVEQTKRSVKSSATKAAASIARANQTNSTTTTTSTATSVTTTTSAGFSSNDMLDDRMGENAYNGGKLLATEFFQNLKFSFERVPSNEPWYLTFQRQDEHRESMFEYWGNTAYRKLPFELGPLPPLQSDCCILSKIAAIKASKKSKRGISRGNLKCQPSVSSDESTIKKEECDEVSDLVDSTTDSATRSKTKSNEYKTAIATKPIIKDESIEMGDRTTKTSTLSQLLLADSSLNSISLPSAIPNKKKGMLLDASGQPRKSPREHASTLAILSSLVQQRRKRIKEMNGGISPEKMPSYKAAVAATMAAQHSTENSEIDDNDDTNDFDERFQAKVNSINETKTRRRSNQTPISELNNKTTVETIGINPSCSHSSDKIFRLRKEKRRQTESVSSNNESIASKTDKIDEPQTSEKDKQTEHSDELKIPIDEYVDPNKLVRELDEMLDHCYNPNSELNQIMVDCENDCSDLISLSAPKDFVEIVESVKDGPLTYRSLQRGKKRHINKTGWPSIPKRRLTKREQIDSVESIDSNMEDTTTGMNTDDDAPQLNHNFDDGDNFDVDFDETHTMRLNRQCIRTPFCDDNTIQFAVYASSSEKAENSDIFTVSSDSYLDTDAINDTNTAKSRLSADSTATEDDGSMADDKIVNHRSNDESTLEEQSTNETASTSGIVTTSILERTLKIMSTRSTYLRSPTIRDAINLKLQPLVCVQKIPECDLPPNQWIHHSIRQNSSNRNDEKIQLEKSPPTLATTSPLKTKTSPRKLRKPRGRWYRES